MSSISVLLLLALHIQQAQTQPPTIKIVANTACPVTLASAKVTDTDQGTAVEYEAVSNASEDLWGLQVTLLAYDEHGRRIGVEQEDANPSDLPLPAGARKTFSFRTTLDVRAQYLRFGVTNAGVPMPGCLPDSVLAGADADFEPPDVITVNPEGAHFSISNARLTKSPQGVPTMVSVSLSPREGDVVSTMRLSAFAFAYSTESGAHLRTQAFPTRLTSTAATIPLRLPDLADPTLRWKIVVIAEGAVVNQHEWRAQDLEGQAAAAVRWTPTADGGRED